MSDTTADLRDRARQIIRHEMPPDHWRTQELNHVIDTLVMECDRLRRERGDVEIARFHVRCQKDLDEEDRRECVQEIVDGILRDAGIEEAGDE